MAERTAFARNAHRKAARRDRENRQRRNRQSRAERHDKGGSDTGDDKPLGERKDEHDQSPGAGPQSDGEDHRPGPRQRNGRLQHLRIGRMSVSAAPARSVIMVVVLMAVTMVVPVPVPVFMVVAIMMIVPRKGRHMHVAAQRLGPDHPRAEGGDQRIGTDLEDLRGLRDRDRGHVENDGRDADQQDRRHRLGHRRSEGEKDRLSHRLAIGEHIGRDDGLAVTGPGRVEDPVDEGKSGQPPSRIRVGFQILQGGGEGFVEGSLVDRDPREETGEPASRDGGLLRQPDAEWRRRRLDRRDGQDHDGHRQKGARTRGPSAFRMKQLHGQSSIASLLHVDVSVMNWGGRSRTSAGICASSAASAGSGFPARWLVIPHPAGASVKTKGSCVVIVKSTK